MANYSVIVWDNDGVQTEEPTMSNRIVKIGQAGNAIYHWTQRATAEEWVV